MIDVIIKEWFLVLFVDLEISQILDSILLQPFVILLAFFAPTSFLKLDTHSRQSYTGAEKFHVFFQEIVLAL